MFLGLVTKRKNKERMEPAKKKGRMESCDRDREEMVSREEKKTKILLQTVNWDVECFSYDEFYTIDMENGQVSELPHVLLADAGSNSMVALGSAIYVVGCQRWESIPCPEKPPNSILKKKGLYHKGMSYLEDISKVKLKLKPHHQHDDDDDDSNDDDCDWKGVPCPEWGLSRSPSVVAFGGKIYLFHTGGTSASAAVFNPVSNEWDTLLPPPQVGFFDALYTTSAVADPDHDRILVHFYTSDSVFAYYPHNPPRWELFMSPSGWSTKLVLVDGIIFEYLPENPELVVAFHLPTRKVLNVVFTSDLSIKVWRYEFDNIISLGDGILSLVAFTSPFDYSPPRTEVSFAKFSFHHPPDRPADILITPLPVETFTLNTLCEVRNYLLI